MTYERLNGEKTRALNNYSNAAVALIRAVADYLNVPFRTLTVDDAMVLRPASLDKALVANVVDARNECNRLGMRP